MLSLVSLPTLSYIVARAFCYDFAPFLCRLFSFLSVGNFTRTQEAEEIKKLKEALAAKEKEIAALKNKK